MAGVHSAQLNYKINIYLTTNARVLEALAATHALTLLNTYI
jgi:hypothetical protein